MAIQLVVALLALFSLGAASEPDCHELVQPLLLEDRSPIYGKWIYQVGTTDNEESLKGLKTLNNSWIVLSPTSDSDVVSLRWADRVGEKCFHGKANTTFTINSTTVTFEVDMHKSFHYGKYLKTCPDCLLYTDDAETVTSEGTKQNKNLFLFTRNRKLEASQLEVFKKQAVCLNFVLESHFGDDLDLCPGEKEEDASH